ncbi:MAG: peptidoglycan binding protein CsiV [Marinobacter sp.]|nr:peptidoglycan binding protein CsiV [Marinobacter sp.]
MEAHLNHWQDATSKAQPGVQSEPQLLTWIRETRRMRSSEIHFLDSPTIGVLIYFAKIEN